LSCTGVVHSSEGRGDGVPAGERAGSVPWFTYIYNPGATFFDRPRLPFTPPFPLGKIPKTTFQEVKLCFSGENASSS
jgi:hypothetical protein